MNTPRKHKDVIIAYANGAEIEFNDCGKWVYSDFPSFLPEFEYRIKPEREWPVTSLSKDELFLAYNSTNGSTIDDLLSVANAAIKQYIIDSEK